MPSWEEVRAHLRAKFTLARDTDDMVGLVYRFPDKGGEILQGVRLSPVELSGETWLSFLADICPEASLPLRIAVQRQCRMIFGALVVAKKTWLLRHSLPLPNLTFADLERSLRLMAREAALLRAALGHKAKDPKMFSAYED